MLSALTAAALAASFPATSKFSFRGHNCAYVTAGSGPPILLLHGFAGSSYNCWRSTVPELAKTHTVYSMDLLGQGQSDQPADVTYSIDLWREQSAAFCSEKLNGESPIVIGHSFGSLVALELAASDVDVKAVGMMNCGIGMNNKGVLNTLEAEWQIAIAKVFLGLVDLILNQKWLILNVFSDVERLQTLVRNALQGSVYVNADRVDDELVNDYVSLAADKEAAAEVLRQIYTNDSGPVPFTASAKLPADFPICTIWGDEDNLAPSTGPVGKHFRARATTAEATRFDEIRAGHVPQDDNPQVTNAILGEWLASL